MLPNMQNVVSRWAETRRVKTVTKETVDFEPVNTVAGRDVDATIQVADKSKLNPDTVDWSLNYILIHAMEQIDQGEFIEYLGEDYKIIERGNWLPYGYMETVGESTNKPMLQET